MPVANVWSKQRVVLNSLNTRTLPTGKRIKSWTNIQVKSITLFSGWFGGTTSLTKRFKNGFTKEFLIRARHFFKKFPIQYFWQLFELSLPTLDLFLWALYFHWLFPTHLFSVHRSSGKAYSESTRVWRMFLGQVQTLQCKQDTGAWDF